MPVRIGIIGGSGLYDMAELADREEKVLTTPFGDPSRPWILSASAVGSLQEQYRPMDLVFPDQFIDRTRGRVSTFFGDGIVAHVGFAHPLCGELSALAAACAE